MEVFCEKELIMFYNVENLFPPDLPRLHKHHLTRSGLRNWDQRKYVHKIQKIASVFKEVEEQEQVLPMIIGLAEVYGEENLKDLVKLPPFNSHFGIVHYDSLDERGVDTALLYDKRKLTLLHAETFSFVFEQTEAQQEYLDTTRDVLFCQLKYQEETLYVLVLHLPSKRDKDVNLPKRAFILKAVQQKIIKWLSDSPKAILVCGDFNENPTEENLQHFLNDALGKKILINPFIELYEKKKYSTFHRTEGQLFDQIMHSDYFMKEDTSLRYEKAHVFTSEKISSRDKKMKGKPYRTYAGTRYLGGYSDHFPVLLTIKKINN